MAAPRCNAAAVGRFLLAALHSVAKRVRRGQAYHPTRVCPRLPEDRTARLRRHDPQLRSRCRAIAVCPRGWKRSQDSVFWFLLSPGVVHSSPSSGKWGRPALASTRGPCGAGGRAFRGLTRSATEMERGEAEANTGRRDCISAQPFLQTLRPVGFRRATAENFRPGNFRSARDLEGAERVNPRKARLPPLRPRLVTRNEECPHLRRFDVVALPVQELEHARPARDVVRVRDQLEPVARPRELHLDAARRCAPPARWSS